MREQFLRVAWSNTLRLLNNNCFDESLEQIVKHGIQWAYVSLEIENDLDYENEIFESLMKAFS